MAEFEYRPIKMPPTPYFTLVTTRGQRSIMRLTTNPTRGQYHSNGTTLNMHMFIPVSAVGGTVAQSLHTSNAVVVEEADGVIVVEVVVVLG